MGRLFKSYIGEYKVSHYVKRKHEICAGHRVVGHEGKCKNLHGHNYTFHFICKAEDSLDEIGRVIDFSVIKDTLCMWLEKHWDHRFLVWQNDFAITSIQSRFNALKDEGIETTIEPVLTMLKQSIVWVPFNPTAENIAEHMVNVVGPKELAGTGVVLVECRIEETGKCEAGYSKRKSQLDYLRRKSND